MTYRAEYPQEWDGDRVRIDDIRGLTAPDRKQLLQNLPPVSALDLHRGSLEVGAATEGIDLLLTFQQSLSTVADFAGAAWAVKETISWVKKHRKHRPIISDELTQQLVAIGHLSDDEAERFQSRTAVCLDRSQAGGKDGREIFATAFPAEDRALVLFTSGDARLLGRVEVPRAIDLSINERLSTEDIARRFREWNGISG
jgi:hypothetical protein